MPGPPIAETVTGVTADVELGVRRYLGSLDRDRLQRRLMLLSVLLPTVDSDEYDAVAKERRAIRARLDAYAGLGSVEDHVSGFITQAATYAQACGITVSSWRAMGVPDPVMVSAGLVHRRSGGNRGR